MSYHYLGFCEFAILLAPTLFNIVCLSVLHDLCSVCIVVFNHNVINLYFTTNESTLDISYYDKVFTCLHNLSLCLNCHFFIIPLRWQIQQILLYLHLQLTAQASLFLIFSSRLRWPGLVCGTWYEIDNDHGFLFSFFHYFCAFTHYKLFVSFHSLNFSCKINRINPLLVI